MFCCGISDEAGRPIDTQIQAHKELGWKHLELRIVDGGALTDVPDAEFDLVLGKVKEAGMKIVCFASQLANWSRKITNPFGVDEEEMKRAVPRMKKAGTKYIRVMSYPNDGLIDTDWHKEVLRRLKILVKMAEDGGVTLVHENCDGWGGESVENSLTLLQEINSESFQYVFDTGNPVHHHQNAFDFYRKVRKHVVHVHIKDGKIGPDGKTIWTFPGEGTNEVQRIVADLLATGYDGGFSIEPHMVAVIHEGKTSREENMYPSYLEYGRRLVKIVETAKKGK